MKVLGLAAIIESADREGAVRRFTALFGGPPLQEFPIEGRDLHVSVFPGLSVLTGAVEALFELADLRATVFVDSLTGVAAQLQREGWSMQGSLGSDASVLARDSDGNLLEFVERPGEPG